MPKIVAIAVLIALAASGCSLMPSPQHGGSAHSGPVSEPTKAIAGNIAPASGSDPRSPTLSMPQSSITQSDNPNSNSAQSVDYEYEEVIVAPIDTVKETITNYPDGHSVIVREPQPAGTRVIRKTKSNVNQQLGSSWKDTARELGAALGSFRMVQYAGIGLLLFGAVAFFHPVLRTLVGGKDTAMAVGGCGVVMMFGPYLFVTYSNYFFLAILAAGGYWLIARFKYQHGKLDILESQAQEPTK